ncbi:MAG: IPT/TIG domain-containing protein [Bacteroidetes bacterium]|nr:IPT/TIG domain-containing protein [Fibrella sp.]
MKSILVRYLAGLVAFVVVGCQVQKFPPELWRPTPSFGAIGRDITLEGSQFGDNPSVTFTSSPTPSSATAPFSLTTATATVKTKTDALITVTVPRLPIGVAQVRVSNEQGITDPVAFTVLQPAPALTTITPENALPGAKVQLTGDYLDQLNNVKFGINEFYPGTSSVTLVSAQTVEVTLPATISRGPQAVSVETTGGIATGNFIVSGTPEITGISPKRVKAGTEILIQGKNLTDGSVRINGLMVDKTLSSFKDTEIRTVVPATATSGRITVTVFEKLVANSADSLIIVGAPVLAPTALTVLEGIKGDIITLTGTGLLDVSAVSFGDTPATFRVLSSTQLEVTVPDRSVAGAVPVTVTSVGGTSTSTQLFVVILAPAGLTFEPVRQARGRDITIRGRNLNRITAVTIGGRPAPITTRTEGTELRATVPADATGGTVAVSNRAGSVGAPGVLTVVLPPTVTDFTKQAVVSGRLVIKGTFLQNALVFFNGNNYPAVDNGKNEDAERWVVVTGDAQSGPIRIVNDAGEVTTTESFAVLRPSTISDFSPRAGKIGAEVTITGLNVADVTEIRFSGGKSAPATFRRSGNTLIATVPAGTVDGTICLTNPAGAVCTSAEFTVQVPPVVTGFLPLTAKVGTDLTITGQNLADATEVRFGGGKSGPATIIRRTAISLIVSVPATATDGTICVTNPAGSACTTASFVVAK